MKKNQNQQKDLESSENQSKIRIMIIGYIDNVIRGLISFFCVGVLVTIILIYFFHWNFILVLPVIFLISIMISPMLSKIRYGEKILDKYEDFLKKKFNLKELSK